MEFGSKIVNFSNLKVPKIKSKIILFDGFLSDTFPLNSLVLISGEGGISKSLILQNICYSLLKRGFSCIYLCADEHPLSVYQNMQLASLNVKNFLKKNRLFFIDCFSYKLNLNLNSNNGNNLPIVYIQYPSNWQEIMTSISNVTKNVLNNSFKAAIFIDSFTDLASRFDLNSSIDFIKCIRYEFCKKRYIPVFTSFHFGIRPYEELEQIIEYHVDGIVDLRYDPYYLQKGSLVKQIRIRKLKGVEHDTSWHYIKIINGRFLIVKDKKVELDVEELKYQNINQKWSEDRKYQT